MKLLKKIGLICLCLTSLSLVGCFHVPDEDWLPSKNKVETGNIEEENEMNQALDSFMDGINIISSERNEISKDDDATVETDEAVVEDETEKLNTEENYINEKQDTENIEENPKELN